MAKFKYKGKTKEGEPVVQTVEAEERYDVYDIARENGHEIVSIEEVRSFSMRGVLSMEKINAFLGRIKRDEIIMHTRNLSAMLKAGLALTRGLSVAERQTKNPRLRAVVVSLREEVSKGKSFHEALALHPKHFSDLYVAMVRAGEEGGKLSEALSTISMQLQQASELQKKIKGAMIYPAIVLTVMFGIGVMMMIYVVPTLTSTFKEMQVDLPITTQIIMGVSDFLVLHPLMNVLVLIGIGVGFFAIMRIPLTRRGFEWVVVRLPVIGNIAKEMNSARTTRTLSSLLSSGVDPIAALSITADVVQNSFYKEVIKDAALRIEKGKPLSEAFIERDDLYPTLVGEMIAVGEETGQISNMLVETALFYESEVDRKTKDLSTIIEPILMVVIGAGVGFFALAMIMPIYSISDSL